MSSSALDSPEVAALLGRRRSPSTPMAARVLTVLLGVTAAAPFPFSGPVVFGLALLAFGYAVLSGPTTRPHLAVVAVLGWAALTVAWSVAPGETVRGVLITVASTWAVCSLAAQLPRAQVYRALAAALKILIVLSWLLYLGAPAAGRVQEAYHRGALTGVFVQRNSAAFVLAVAVLTFAFMAAAPRLHGRRAAHVAWAALALGTLVATESGTGLAVTLVCTLLMAGASRVHRWSDLAKRALLVLVGGLAAAAALNAQAVIGLVTDLLGRESTLTGRTVIWAAVEPYVQAQPWAGYGWGALWTDQSLMTRAMWAQVGIEFPHAHNAYLDALAQSGIVGLVLVLLVCAAVLWRGGALLLSGRDGVRPTWPVVVIVCLLLYGISEQSFMGYFGWLVVVLATVLVRPGRLDEDAADAASPTAAVTPA